MVPVAEDIWLLRYPLSLLGIEAGRNVTVIRLRSGELIIHSTAPFSEKDAREISALGRPVAMLDATVLHDTYVDSARRIFPDLPYYSARGRLGGNSLAAWPPDWRSEADVLELRGMRWVHEYVFLHRPSRTLIVGDLLFNMPAATPAWTLFAFRLLSRMKTYPAMSFAFRLSIRDKAAFRSSMDTLLAWDFDRIIVGHGDVIERGGKQALCDVLARHDLLP